MPRYLFIILLMLPFYVKGQVITTVAGDGTSNASLDGISAINANIGFITSVRCNNASEFYFVNGIQNKVRKVDAVGIVTTVAGNGSSGYSGDNGLATLAKLDNPTFIALDDSNNVYISDQHNNRIRKINTIDGTIITVAGNGSAGYTGDGGQAILASINEPHGIAIDQASNLYFVDHLNFRIRKVNLTTGVIVTIAGTGTSGYSGDEGLALNAQIGIVYGMTIDLNGNIYFCDAGRVRKINVTTNIISTIAGNGMNGYNGDGIIATNASLWLPYDVAIDDSMNVFIADMQNNRVRLVNPQGIIHTVAGMGIGGYSGDGGSAISAQIHLPEGVAIDNNGSLYIADLNNKRIRKVTNSVTISDITRSDLIYLYPNPANENVTITGHHLQSISITNTLGQVVHWQKVSQEKTVVDVSALGGGVYFVTVVDMMGGKVVRKVVKE